MAIKDRIVKWFIQNVVIPQQEIIDKPGFIVEAYNKSGTQVFLREIVLPEDVISKLEKTIISKFGTRGKGTLYTAGKTFGYAYANRSFFPKITKSAPRTFENFIYLWMRYVEATSFGKLDYVFDKNRRTIKIECDNFIICPKNGLGYFLPSGSFAGFWAYLTDDDSAEFVQTKCKGRGDKKCEGMSGPKKTIDEIGMQPITSKVRYVPWNYELEKNINAIRPCRFNNKSLKDIIDSNFFKYSHGILTWADKRCFIMDSSVMYILENELLKIDKSDKIFFDLSFEFGMSAFDHAENNSESLISSYLTAMGYGDVQIFKKKGKYCVSSDFFPWTPYIDRINFAYYRGLVSGLLSKCLKKEIVLKKFICDVSRGFFRLEISE